ncbi:ATP-binding cassette domain-containing protein [Microlunatus sp. GCM10028923]|uniref:ATP-binding cassette domain-containing protein n=1 Tax=Microlunatus sp. GCM10028923 TaxID=3273400 RepID=UPI00361808A2
MTAESKPVQVAAGEVVATGLTWRPHGRREPTLRDLTLTLRPGERVLLAGASGSGKSTLLRLLAGLADESLGELTGALRLPDERPGRAGLLLQDPGHAVVAEHAGRDVAFGPENRRADRPEILSRSERALDAVRFPYPAVRRSTDLSGGETQRLALAGALALDPALLLLDEPTAMLDPEGAATVRRAVVEAVADRPVTVVVVDHRPGDWLDFCDRLIVLGPDGSLLADGPADAVLAERGAELAAAGVWVPEAPRPEPVPVSWPASASGSGPAVGLRVCGLAVDAPGRERSAAEPLIDGLDLDVRRGDLLAVRGPSGSGKSTLLRVLAGLRPARTGSVTVAGAALPRRSRELARRVSWQPQYAEQQLTRRTVEAEVLATSEAVLADDPEALRAARARADAILAALGLDRLRGADPYTLSGGEQRRVALAAAVAHRPDLVLLDEPTVGQDRGTWAAVAGVIDALRADGAVVVVATHDQELAARADRTVELGGTGEAPDERPDHRIAPVVEPGDPPAARCNPVALLIIALGAAIGSFFVSDWRVGLITLALSLLLAPLAVRGVRPTLARLVPVTLAAITVGWSALAFSERGFLAPDAWPVAAAEVTRIACLVIPGVLLIPSLPPSRLGDALAQRCRVPHRPVVAAAAGLLRLQHLLDVWRTMADVRRIRGLDPGRSPAGRVRQAAGMTFALLVYALRSAQQSALSMDARGFAGARRRTFALPSPWRGVDWLAVGVAVLLTAAPILLSLGFG